MACLSPFYVDNPRYPYTSKHRQIPAPCGKCPDCLHRRSAAWVFRMLQEDKISTSAYFVTLTYDNAHCPMSRNGFMTLNKKDVQDYFKRVRIEHQRQGYDQKIRYYTAGEYGTTTQRPHYHLIVFNADFKILSDKWGKGVVQIDPVNGKTVAYTTKYINKGKIIGKHSRDDRVPEYSAMSKGLGKNYMSDDIVKYHKADLNRNYVVNEGYKVPMPRYYRERIFTDKEREKQSISVEKKHIDDEQKRMLEFKKRTGSFDGYDKAKHEQKKARIENFKRKQNERKKI